MHENTESTVIKKAKLLSNHATKITGICYFYIIKQYLSILYFYIHVAVKNNHCMEESTNQLLRAVTATLNLLEKMFLYFTITFYLDKVTLIKLQSNLKFTCILQKESCTFFIIFTSYFIIMKMI
jgi:hypothetical protein